MRWQSFLGALVLLVLVAGSASAEMHAIPLKGGISEMTVTADTRDAVSFRISIAELQAIDVETKEGPFTRLIIPGFHSSQVEGAPELPMMNRLLSVPLGARARVTVTKAESRLIDLAQHGVRHALLPAQPSMPKSADPETWPFVYDRAAYQADKVGRELTALVEQGRLRAMDLARLEISPVEYYPLANQIRVFDSIELTVEFAGADHAAAQELVARTHSPFFAPVYAQVANAKGFHDSYPDRVRDVVTMVVVTPPMFASQLQPFVDWKTERGFHMVVGVTGTPEVGTTTTSIRNYIHNLYNNATPQLPAPSFVLFVGDVEQMPTWFEAGDATDRPYCAVDADLVPDIYYGRFSATNSSQLQAILDKTMMYDQFTMPDPSYLGEVCMIAGVDSYWAPTHANGQINYGTTYYFNAAHGILSHTYLYPASGSSGPQIIQDVSNGVALVNYTAHGSQTSWSNPSFTQANVNGLQNAGKYTLAIGNCCLTSTYDYSECFAETWLRAPNKGAVGYIGGSNSTYWDEDFWWGVGYRATINANPVYDANALGAYDGLFHDHGENENLHYVTNDAIIFCGNLAVMQSGSSRITYYWNIYNLMGDPSLSTYLGVPAVNPVTHPATVFTSWTSLDVTAVPGSYVGLTQGGVLVGAGTVGAGGTLAVEFLQTPLTPGVPLRLVVMAQNRQPYTVDLNVIVPATVLIDPDVIDANVATDITVTVLDADGVVPQPGVDIWAEGLMYQTAPVATGPDGVAVITVDYPFGPTLGIVGKRPADSYRLFTEQVAVNALPLTMPDLTVSTDIGLSDAFALNLPGTLHASLGESGHTLYARLPGGALLQTDKTSLTLTPAQLGQVEGIIAVSGHDLYRESFDIIEAYGTLAGTVTSGGSPLASVTVRGYDGLGDLAFSAVTNAGGAYNVAADILVASYTIMVDLFGYLHYEAPLFVNYGANVYDIDLDPAPSGVLSGTVAEVDTGLPLAATVRVYRSDTMALYATATTDPATGAYATIPLPYFDYVVNVRAYQHRPLTIGITVDAPAVQKHFLLETTAGDLLVLDGGAKGPFFAPDKYDEKGQLLLAPGFAGEGEKSATTIVTDLEDLGFSVTYEDIDATDPVTWTNYDAIIVACGANITTLPNSAHRAALVNHVNNGGHILLEGGEVGYDHYASDLTFARTVMRTDDWNHDSSGSLTVSDPTHYVMSVPNAITGPVSFTYNNYGDQDAMVPTNGGVRVASWSSWPTDSSIIVYDPNPGPQGGQIVFWCFNYLAMDAAVRPLLLENTVTWLVTPEFGDASVSGQALLMGESSHAGITVRALPGGGEVVTGANGAFTLSGLYAGTYQIVASKTGWSTRTVEVTLSPGQNLTGVSLVLQPVFQVEACVSPMLNIPDNNPTGVSSTMTIDTPGELTGVEVYVNITHTWIGDLIVRLTSPSGTAVTLHSRSGGSADNIVGWYPSQLAPAQSLDAFLGEPMTGAWTLFVSDNAGSDLGMLRQWCLRLTYAGVVSNVAGPLEAFAHGGGVTLVWNYNAAAVDGFHVYRRIEDGPALRLTETPVRGHQGHIEYHDAPAVAAGTQLFYSYAAVIGGAEQGRSAEVAIVAGAGVPAVFALRGNHPNPFNPATTIAFDVPRPGHVTLRIYDLSGRLVRTLVDEALPAAAHSRLWDGTDGTGRRVASGAYYYQLSADGFTQSRKMMMIK